MKQPIKIQLITTKKSEKRIEKIKEKIYKQIQAHQKELPQYQITIQIKKKTWVRKMKLFMIALLFTYRLRKILQRVQHLGVSNIIINPSFRDLQYIQQQLTSHQNYIQIDDKKPAKKTLFYPNTIVMVIWNCFIFISISICLILYPLYINFRIDNTIIIFILFLVDLIFIIDFFIGFNLAYKKSRNQFEQNRFKIFIKYLKGKFLLNFITAIPFYSIFYNRQVYNNLNQDLKVFNFITILLFLKTLKAFKIQTLAQKNLLPNKINFFLKMHENQIDTFYIIYITFMIVHVIACMFINISLIESLEPHTWLHSQELIYDNQIDIYFASLYYCFVVLTTVGFGDIVSQNNLERIFTLFWMLFGIAFYSFTIGFITNFFTSKENKKTLLAKKLKQFDKFAQEKQIDQDLQEQIKDGLKHSTKEVCYRWIENDMNIIENLPKQQKYLFLKSLHSELFKCKFFSTNDFNFNTRIMQLLQPLKIKKGDFLWKKEDYAKYICFITSGQVFLLTNNIFIESQYKKKSRKSKILKKSLQKLQNIFLFWRQNPKVNSKISLKNLQKDIKQNTIKFDYNRQPAQNLQELKNCNLLALKIFGVGSYIGEEEIIQNSTRQYWVRAATDVELMVLSRDNFENIFKIEFPHKYNTLVENSIKKIKNQSNCKMMLYKKIRKMIEQQQNLFLNMDLNQQLNKDFKIQRKPFKNRKIYKDQKQFFDKEQLKSYIQDTILNVDVKEYISEDEHEELYQETNTPGFQKVFKEWKDVRIKLNDEHELLKDSISLDKIKNKIKIDFLDQSDQLVINRQVIEEHEDSINQVFNIVQENKANVYQIQDIIKQQLYQNSNDTLNNNY